MNQLSPTLFRRRSESFPPGPKSRNGWIASGVILLGMLSTGHTGESAIDEHDIPSPRELRELTIEELLELRIVAVARRPEPVRTTPSAVSVLTADQIRRSGAATLPDALRLATGVHVAQSNTNTWGIGVRGFNMTTTNKLLVLQDGRSLYSPLFAGVFWDVQNPMLEDIERIEVVRGPGATMWGANAVNGVINIVTRDARETQGLLVTGGAGSRERGFGAARFGGQINEHTWYRVYGTGWEREDMFLRDGTESGERRRFAQGGFRVDSDPLPEVRWTFQGDIYDGEFDRMAGDPIDASGANLLGRWTRSTDSDNHLSLQAYYDRVQRDIPGTWGETRDTFDMEFQHRVPAGERHEIMWGGNARFSRDDIDNTGTITFIPESRTIELYSGFIQDTIALDPDHLDLTIGSRFEHNSYSGFEYQPSVRMAWMPTLRQTVWGAVSRATRTPSRLDTDVLINPGTPAEIRGNPDFQSERLHAYELGYRVRPADPLTLDFAFFYHDYDRIRSIELDEDPTVLDNLVTGNTHGGAVTVNYRVSEWWRIRSGYAHLQRRIHPRAESSDDRTPPEGNDPRHIGFLHSSFNLGEQWTLDGVVRHVGRLPSPPIPAYTELDLRAAYQVNDDLELSLTGRNLLNSHHREFGTTHAVPRSVFFRLTWGL